MMKSAPAPHVAVPSDDAELVRRALARDDGIPPVMERHNRRLYRIARGMCGMIAKPKIVQERTSKPTIWTAFAAIPRLRHGFPASP